MHDLILDFLRLFVNSRFSQHWSGRMTTAHEPLSLWNEASLANGDGTGAGLA